MGTKLYVGNLSFNTTETDLQDLFAQAGPVQEVTLMQDKFTGKSRGFAFVTMTTDADAQKAVTEFNGKTVEGRPLTVNEARPREARPPGGGGGGGYGGGGGGRGGGGGGYGGGGGGGGYGGGGGGGGYGGGRRDGGGRSGGRGR
ncbi:MAG: RNA-binding protein [Chthoniobacterales bacterium]